VTLPRPLFLKVSYCTATAMASVPEWKILNRSRHKTAELIARYVRAEEVAKDSGSWLFSAKGIAMAAQRKRTIKLFRIVIAGFA
jgi:hypothetical protein